MKSIFLYAVLPFLPLLGLLGTSSADRPPLPSQPPSLLVLCSQIADQACTPPVPNVRCIEDLTAKFRNCQCISQRYWLCL